MHAWSSVEGALIISRVLRSPEPFELAIAQLAATADAEADTTSSHDRGHSRCPARQPNPGGELESDEVRRIEGFNVIYPAGVPTDSPRDGGRRNGR